MKIFTWVNRYVFFFAGLIGAAVFLLIYGVDIVNPWNTQWLLAGGDLAQHYIGWQFFKQSAWTFPIGVAQDLAYPHGLAITFMDSIPLLAIPAKVVAGSTNQTMQYFGLWGLASFALTSGMSALIVKRWTKNSLIILLSSLLPLMMPIMLTRMFRHTALAGQWILLLALWILLSTRRSGTKRFVVWWSVCLILSVLIHPYFAAMNIFLMVIGVVWRYRTLRQAVVQAVVPMVAMIVASWVIGGFTVKAIGAGDLGKYGFDIASPFNPQSWSSLYGQNFANNGESLGYAGAGLIVLSVIALVVIFAKRRDMRRKLQLHRWQVLITCALVVSMLLVAIGPKVFVGGVFIVEYPVPSLIEKIWSIVRATARISWPLYYLVLFASLYVIIRFVRLKNEYFLVAGLGTIVLLQALDVYRSPQAVVRSGEAHQVAGMIYKSQLLDKRWDVLAKNKAHLVYVGYGLYGKNFIDLAEFSLARGMTINNGYFARYPTAAINQTIDIAKNELATGKLRNDTLYVYDKTRDDIRQVSSSVRLHELNNLTVATESDH